MLLGIKEDAFPVVVTSTLGEQPLREWLRGAAVGLVSGDKVLWWQDIL